MIDRAFWEEVRDSWTVKAAPQIKDIKTSSGGDIDPELLQDPWDSEEISFDMVDFDQITKDILKGGDIPLKQTPAAQKTAMPDILETESEQEKSAAPESVPQPEKPRLDTEKFDTLMEGKTLPNYREACRQLLACALPKEIDEIFEKIADRMQVLQETLQRFENADSPELGQLCEYYIPETLQVAASYLEYRSMGIDEQILQETVQETMAAAEKLLLTINDIIDEIYRFASIEIKARAKAVESIMSMGGHVDPSFKIK